jgi:structural maintenance of chromosome 2
MKKKVDPKVMNMIDMCVLPAPAFSERPNAGHFFSSVEKREASLKKMLGTVLKDKEKTEQTIKGLDRYKRDALKTTWEKVNG